MDAMARQTLAHFLGDCAVEFSASGITDPVEKVRELAAYVLGCHPRDIDKLESYALSEDEQKQIKGYVARHIWGQPISRILGHRVFYGLPFILNEATLDPRFISEVLVDTALSYLQKNFFKAFLSRMRVYKPESATRILDLGTGTGCLLLSLLYHMPYATGLGIDLAPRAVECAESNALKLKLHHRASFKSGFWFDAVEGDFDLIISNPPYIPHGDLAGVMPVVAAYDPVLALDGGEDGLDAYRAIIAGAPRYLKPQGLLVLEPGDHQEKALSSLLTEAGLKDIKISKDKNGTARCITAKRLRA